MKTRLFIAVKVLVSLSLLGYILAQLDWDSLLSRSADITWWGLPVAVAVMLCNYGLGTLRWALLLRNHHPEYRVAALFRPFMIGAFFNNVLPSSTGGDLVRSYYIYRYERNAVSALSPIITERVLGLVVLLAITVTSITLAGAEAVVTRALWLPLNLFLAAGIVGLVIIAIPASYWPLHRLLERLARFRVAALLLRIGEATHGYLRRPALIAGVVMLSVVAQLLVVLCYQLLALAMGITIPFGTLLVVTTIAMITASLPITVGGMGVREITVVALMVRFGVETSEAAATALFFIPVMIVSSLPGLWFYLTRKDARTLMQEAATSRLADG